MKVDGNFYASRFGRLVRQILGRGSWLRIWHKEFPVAEEIQPIRRLPYFDIILDRLQKNDPDFSLAFGRHVHWGYWDDPRLADGTIEDFAYASERLCHRLLAASAVAGGQAILDVGCGLGGTLATLNEMLADACLVGINIDERQLARAVATVLPCPGNTIYFVHGDGCLLPISSAAFDRVLAVECIFNFPSRREFFREARRALRRGGKLVISDSVATISIPALGRRQAASAKRVARTFGPITRPQTLAEYSDLARGTGFVLSAIDDITTWIMPSFQPVRDLMRRTGWEEAAWATGMLEAEFVEGISRYTIMSFDAAEPITKFAVK